MKKILLGLIGLLFAVPAVATDSGSISSVTVAGLVAQNGTPTPNAPVDIVSNNGVVKVSPNLFDVDNNLLAGYYIDSTNGILKQSTDGSSSCFKDFLPSKPNVTYTMSRLNVRPTTMMRMWAYDKDKNPISLVFNSGQGANKITGTTPNGTAYIRCSFGSIPEYSQNIQLELGSTATEYRPYGEIYTDGTVETITDSANHTATVATLLGVGDNRDTQNINTGAITRNVGVKVFDGTENWAYGGNTSGQGFYLYFPEAKLGTFPISTHFNKATTYGYGIPDKTISRFSATSQNIIIKYSDMISGDSTALFKQYLADQYAAGTPVIVVYPLATETTESVAGQTMTIAPVDNRTGGVTGMTITTLLSSGASVVTTIANNAIRIATTAYNSARFSPVVTELNDTIATIRSVVTNTINQTKAIADLQATKQTRPDEQCPAGKKCLLVEDDAGQPHWYEIIESAD